MKSLQSLFLLLFGITAQLSFGQFTDEINSNRPGKSMMAYAVGKKIIQTETGVTYVSEDHNLLGYNANGFIGELDIRYGVWKEELESLVSGGVSMDLRKRALARFCWNLNTKDREML